MDTIEKKSGEKLYLVRTFFGGRRSFIQHVSLPHVDGVNEVSLGAFCVYSLSDATAFFDAEVEYLSSLHPDHRRVDKVLTDSDEAFAWSCILCEFDISAISVNELAVSDSFYDFSV